VTPQVDHGSFLPHQDKSDALHDSTRSEPR
jgi:hypothetical protein